MCTLYNSILRRNIEVQTKLLGLASHTHYAHISILFQLCDGKLFIEVNVEDNDVKLLISVLRCVCRDAENSIICKPKHAES